MAVPKSTHSLHQTAQQKGPASWVQVPWPYGAQEGAPSAVSGNTTNSAVVLVLHRLLPLEFAGDPSADALQIQASVKLPRPQWNAVDRTRQWNYIQQLATES